MNSHQLFRRSRARLALWYAGVMAVILSLSGLSLYRSLIQSNWAAMEREIKSIAGTLHDSLEPMLPTSGKPTAVLRRILPELCVAQQPCNVSPTLIQRHTTGISDRNTYYIRLFSHQGKLLAFSPNQPRGISTTFNSAPWQTFRSSNGIRYHQFTIILHSHYASHSAQVHRSKSSWGYLQIGRTLENFDAEVKRMQWILAVGFSIALGLVALSSWWLSGLAMQPIYQSYQQQQQFTANAAHELRSPLASLLATVEAILRVPHSNQQDISTMLQTVERQGRRLSHLVADLLLLTRLEQNSSPTSCESCCLNDIINDLTEEFLELATMAEIHLVNQLPHEHIYVSGNESQLYRLVSNLIANAIQYTPRGGHVMIDLTRRDRLACIAVKDTGIGMDAKEHTRIFERFYRVDSDRCRETGGTGLGLALVQAIAQKHHAQLEVESHLGSGSTFTLKIPVSSVTQKLS
ncbi:two-component system sensor histidine kinase RppB [Phormidium sp. CCY1219]|uniref:two-component system sensor histidine kinase RppB n=1 Tax=Phormidium sp. CCY1219 TaxID=2886104 RepID=UPI002D1E543F|nr:two-component system sensor histidine kinase RppB [Phormidium sp. CCY1219]MEB3827204.1 two-component sensor histidine kinase [Phormidium sp. CCY1219]